MSDTTAIIQLAGKQYVVAEGDVLEVNRLDQKADATFEVGDVLLVFKGDATTVGTPLVSKATVKLQVVGHEKGEKIRVATYKAKSRYRRVKGHRQELTQLKVVSISA